MNKIMSKNETFPQETILVFVTLMLIFICLFRPLGLFITRRVTEKGPTRTTKAATVARPSRSRDWSVSLSSSNSGTRGTRWWPMLTWIIHTVNWPTSPPSAGHSASTIGVVGNAPTHRPSAAIKIHFQHFPSYWWQPLRAALAHVRVKPATAWK